MIDMRYKPRFLPQVSAPYDVIFQKLDDEGVKYSTLKFDPEELKPMQGIVISDEVDGVTVDDNKPIWVASDNSILDGHHRWVKALGDQIPIIGIKLDVNSRDGSRILNKIQDIYEYEQSQEMEEVEVQDTINYYGDDENQFLKELEISNKELNEGEPNNTTVIGYRKDPIRENSVVGNFFLLKPQDGFDKYEIEFDNLLDTTALGVTYKDGQEPVDILAKSWFPNINFEKISSEQGIPAINLKNKAVAEKAIDMGYDGIKYGDTLIQGLKND